MLVASSKSDKFCFLRYIDPRIPRIWPQILHTRPKTEMFPNAQISFDPYVNLVRLYSRIYFCFGPQSLISMCHIYANWHFVVFLTYLSHFESRGVCIVQIVFRQTFFGMFVKRMGFGSLIMYFLEVWFIHLDYWSPRFMKSFWNQVNNSCKSGMFSCTPFAKHWISAVTGPHSSIYTLFKSQRIELVLWISRSIIKCSVREIFYVV